MPDGSPPDLPRAFAATRESLRMLACYVLAPARKARTGRIGLRPVEGGFGTPVCDDGFHALVRDDRVVCQHGGEAPITTLRAAAKLLDLPLSGDPGVGSDLPPFDPDAPLTVDVDAARILADWYALGADVLDRVGESPGVAAVSEQQLWPEHFDLAVIVDLQGGSRANVGFSPGDRWCDEPYVYVGPHETAGLDDPYWNVAFGALLPRHEVSAAAVPADEALRFVHAGLALLAGPEPPT